MSVAFLLCEAGVMFTLGIERGLEPSARFSQSLASVLWATLILKCKNLTRDLDPSLRVRERPPTVSHSVSGQSLHAHLDGSESKP